jgi:hypothetical protein
MQNVLHRQPLSGQAKKVQNILFIGNPLKCVHEHKPISIQPLRWHSTVEKCVEQYDGLKLATQIKGSALIFLFLGGYV